MDTRPRNKYGQFIKYNNMNPSNNHQSSCPLSCKGGFWECGLPIPSDCTCMENNKECKHKNYQKTEINGDKMMSCFDCKFIANYFFDVTQPPKADSQPKECGCLEDNKLSQALCKRHKPQPVNWREKFRTEFGEFFEPGVVHNRHGITTKSRIFTALEAFIEQTLATAVEKEKKEWENKQRDFYQMWYQYPTKEIARKEMEKVRYLERQMIWDLLISSLPSDAENLETASKIPDQSQRVLKVFLSKISKLQ